MLCFSLFAYVDLVIGIVLFDVSVTQQQSAVWYRSVRHKDLLVLLDVPSRNNYAVFLIGLIRYDRIKV